MTGGGFGGGPYGGGPYGGAPPAPSPFDLFCFEHCASMLAILTDPDVTTEGPGGHFVLDVPNCDLIIGSGDTFPLTDGRVIVTTSVPQNWTLEWTGRFTELPSDFNDLVNRHIFVGSTNAAGPCAGLFISKLGVMYAGAIHHTGAGDMVLDSTTQVIPGSAALIAENEYITFRMSVSGLTGGVYIFVTKTADIPVTGQVLIAVVPTIDASVLAFPPTDRTIVSVRGLLNDPSVLSLDKLCLASTVLIPNLIPVADAGSDQAARNCSIVQLDGSGSFDPEGAPLVYLWRLVDAPLASVFSVELNDGATQDLDGTGFTNKFHSLDLIPIDVADPIIVGDVLLLDGVARTVVSTGVEGSGPLTGYLFLLFANQDIPQPQSTRPFKVMRQRGVSGSTTVNPTFFPDLPGFYRFDLTVNDGALFSSPSVTIVNILESPLPRGCTPDLSFLFGLLSDFWNLVEDRDSISVFWSGIAQVAASELFTLWQIDYSKSLRDIQRCFIRRWLHYDPLLPEPIPELTRIRVVFGGVESEPMSSAGVAGISGTTMVISSATLDSDFSYTFVKADPYTAAEVATELGVALEQLADSRFVMTSYANASTTDEHFRIDAPFPFTISTDTTVPGAVIVQGLQNRHPFNTTGGAGVGSKTYKVDRSLQDLDIQENDFLCLDGVAFRINTVIDDAGDDFPFQRVVVKEDLPTAPVTAWDITGFATSELIDFYNGLVSVGDPIFFESADESGTFTETRAVNEIIETTVLGVNETLSSAVAFDPLAIGTAVSDISLQVRIAKVLRRTFVPISDLVQDLPTLTEILVLETTEQEEAVLRRNVDFFLEEVRGRNAIRFVSGRALDPGDVWEGENPPDRLWAEYTFFDNRPRIEENFGIPADLTLDALADLPDEVDYLSAVRGLWYAYTNGPTIRNLRIGTQILLGLPFAEETGTIEEIRTDFSPNESRILIRDKANVEIVRSYIYPNLLGLETNPATGVDYAVGDEVTQFEPLVEGAEVTDYVKDPRWFEGLINQGIFFEVEKFHKFVVRVDSAAFSLSSLLFVRNFILRIKPTYTFPLFLIQLKIGDTEVSTTDDIGFSVRLILTDTPCDGWLGVGTIYDDPRAAGGGWRNQFDRDRNPATAPGFPATESVFWAYDKAFLCPEDPLLGICCTTFAVPTLVTFDSCLTYDTPVNSKFSYTVAAPIFVPVPPVGLAIPSTSGTIVNFAGTVSTGRILIVGPHGSASPSAYELAIDVNGGEALSIPFISGVFGTEIALSALGVAVIATDVVTVRIRPSVGGRINVVRVADLVDGETFTLDDGVNPASIFEFDVTGDGTSDILVDVSLLSTADEVKAACITAINAAASLDITAFDDGPSQIGLVHDTGSTATAVAITETVVDAGFTVLGMTAALASPDWVNVLIDLDEAAATTWLFGSTLDPGRYCQDIPL